MTKSPKVSYEEKIIKEIEFQVFKIIFLEGHSGGKRKTAKYAKPLIKLFRAVRKDTLEAVEKELKENTPEQCGCDCHDLIPGGSCSVCHLNHKVLSLISGMKGGKE